MRRQGSSDRGPKTRHLQAISARDLSAADLARCRRLSFGNQGEMEYSLDDVLRGRRSGTVLLIRDLDETIIAWALFCDVGISAQLFSADHRHQAYFFVDIEHRRNGLGSRLVQAVLRRDPDTLVKSWDDSSEAFFNRYQSLTRITPESI